MVQVAELKLRDDAVRWREIEGELVAVDLASSRYLGSNPSGLALWRALADGACRDELVRRLVEAFGITPERAGADVDRFVGEVAALGLLER
jgi:hypothetical protein